MRGPAAGRPGPGVRLRPGRGPAASAAYAPASDEPAAGKAAEAGHPPAHAAKAEKPNLFEPKPPLALATLIVFALLLFVLQKYAWKPLMEALHEREHQLEHTFQEAEKARAETARLLAEQKTQLDAAAGEVRALLDEARQQAQKVRDDMVKTAQQEAESVRKRAEAEIGAARDQALMDIWGQAADLAVSVAGTVVPRELNAGDHRKLVEKALADLPGPSKANGRGN
ncbi:MAG: F0F1 ATP synthase subunit B [Isosphaeraceae bacterium]